MHGGVLPCDKALPSQPGSSVKHSSSCRAVSALLAGLLAFAPAAGATAAGKSRSAVVGAPYVPLAGALAAGDKARSEAALALNQAKASIGKAADLAAKGRHAQAAEALQGSIERGTMAEVSGAPAPQPGAQEPGAPRTGASDPEAPALALEPLVPPAPSARAAAPAPAPAPTAADTARRVAVPGAPVPSAPADTGGTESPPAAREPAKPAAAGPAAETGPAVAAAQPHEAAAATSRNLVIPRERTPDSGERAPDESAQRAAPSAATRTVSAPSKRIEALEPEQIKTVREAPPEKKNHALLWIIAGVVVGGALTAGGVYLYENGRTPSTATVNASWSK